MNGLEDKNLGDKDMYSVSNATSGFQPAERVNFFSKVEKRRGLREVTDRLYLDR